MLKLVIHVACDECGKRFFFARESDYTTDALRFNTTVLTAMLRGYDWEQLDSEDDRQHFCQECCFNFAEAEHYSNS